MTLIHKAWAFAAAPLTLVLFSGLAQATIVQVNGTAVPIGPTPQIDFVGNTLGVFNGSVSTGSPCSTTLLKGLTYTCNSNFNQLSATDSGIAGIGSNGTGTGDNFGTFTLDDTLPLSYTGNTFTLQVQVSSPLNSIGASGNNTAVSSANLIGSVSGTNSGGVIIQFAPATFNFAFNDPAYGTGTYELALNNLTVNGANSPVTGAFIVQSVTNPISTAGTPTPEPDSILLLGSGLAGLSLVARRLRKA